MELSNRSIIVKCKFCQTVGHTYVGMQPSVLTYILFIFFIIFIGLIPSLFLFAPLFFVTGLKVHK